MRIISGKYGGRPLKSIPTNKTRPTTDKVKEAIFHMAGPYFNGGLGLDLYAGSGGLGIESVSRGIDKMYLVDKYEAATKVIEENIEMTREPDRFEVIQNDSKIALNQLASQNIQFKLVILDPPYENKDQILKDIHTLIELNLLAEPAMIICETGDNVTLPENIGRFKTFKEKNYGKSNVFIYLSGGSNE